MRIWSLSDAQAANRRPSSPARPRPPPESCVVGTRRTSAQCPPIPLPERAHDHFPCPPTAEPGVSELIGAEHGERRPEDRATHRNGYRPRRWDTRAGEIELQIPKIRQGSYFPSFLQPRKRSEQALLSVVQQAYVCGVSTRRVDQLVESLGLRVSRSEVSRICAGLDEQVEAFRTRPLEGRYVYLFLDAKVEKVRDGGRVQRKCVVIAHGVHETGRREIIALDVGCLLYTSPSP